MIYDLKELAALADHIYKHVSDREGIVAITNLAIAERLEALVEAQKPRWVVFDWYTESATAEGKFAINANDVREVSEVVSGGIITHCEITLKLEEILHYVKGTLPEVLAKIRGDQ